MKIQLECRSIHKHKDGQFRVSLAPHNPDKSTLPYPGPETVLTLIVAESEAFVVGKSYIVEVK